MGSFVGIIEVLVGAGEGNAEGRAEGIGVGGCEGVSDGDVDGFRVFAAKVGTALGNMDVGLDDGGTVGGSVGFLESPADSKNRRRLVGRT